jgi:hypothetical protein
MVSSMSQIETISGACVEGEAPFKSNLHRAVEASLGKLSQEVVS